MTIAATRLNDVRLLIVEDQTFTRVMIKHMLNGLGVQHIAEAGDGTEAIETLHTSAVFRQGADAHAQAASPPHADCIICDIDMRPMNGLRFLQTLRTGGAAIARDTPVIMLTSHSDQSCIAAALSLDANGFAVKPATAKAIRERIGRSISTRHPIKPVAAYAAVKLPDLDQAAPADDSAPASDVFGAPPPPGTARIDVNWSLLQEGDVLSDDLTTDTGTMIAPGGTKISAALLGAFRDLSEIVTFCPAVSILRSSP